MLHYHTHKMEYHVECVVRGYHVYQKVRDANLILIWCFSKIHQLDKINSMSINPATLYMVLVMN